MRYRLETIILVAVIFTISIQAEAQNLYQKINLKTSNDTALVETGKMERPFVISSYTGVSFGVSYYASDLPNNAHFKTIDVSDNLAAQNFDQSGNLGFTWNNLPDSIEGQPIHIKYMLTSDGHSGLMAEINMVLNEYFIKCLVNYTDTATGQPVSLSFRLTNELYKYWLGHDTSAATPFVPIESYGVSTQTQKLDSILLNIYQTMTDPAFADKIDDLTITNNRYSNLTSKLEMISNGGIANPFNPESVTIISQDFGSNKSSGKTGTGGSSDDLDDIVYQSTNGSFTVTQLAPDSTVTYPGAEWGNIYRVFVPDSTHVPDVSVGAGGLPTNVSITPVDTSGVVAYDVAVSVELPDGTTGSYDVDVNINDSVVSVTEQPQPPDFDAMNYPNPFTDNTILRYSLKNCDDVRIAVFDVNGRVLDEFMYEDQLPGTHEVVIDGTHYSAGIYYINISCNQAHHVLAVLKP